MKKGITIILAVVGIFQNICCGQKTGKTDLDKQIFTSLEQVVSEMDKKVEGAVEASHSAAAKAEAVFKLKKGYDTAKIDKNIYYKDKIGILSDHGHKMESNIYVGRDTPLDNYAIWYIRASEDMIPVWRENAKKYPYLGWQYLTDTKYTSNRFFPWSETTMSMGADVKWQEFGFYKCVTPENDPQRELRWGRIGSDILGLGLLSSISIPLYVAGDFAAVSSIDFLITQTFGDYLYKEYPGRNSYFMLIDRKTSQVILRNDKNKGERGWDLMFNYIHLNKCEEGHSEDSSVLAKLWTDDSGKIDVTIPDKKVIYFQKLKNVDWVAVIVTETYAD